jgi:hypothetical protein
MFQLARGLETSLLRSAWPTRLLVCAAGGIEFSRGREDGPCRFRGRIDLSNEGNPRHKSETIERKLKTLIY